MDVIIWAIILGAVFYINKKSKNAGSKNTQPNKPRPQQKQIQQIWNSMQNTVQSGMNACCSISAASASAALSVCLAAYFCFLRSLIFC